MTKNNISFRTIPGWVYTLVIFGFLYLSGLHTEAIGQERMPGLPGPYDPIDWLPGYSVNAMILGAPALSVNSRTGLISVSPAVAGLFVFAVKCEEFRNGLKIGEVQRDIQVKVNNCVINTKPAVQVTLPNSSQLYLEGDTLVVSKESNFCHRFSFADKDVGQTISVKLEGSNPIDQPQVTPSIGQVVTTTQVFNGQLCWQPCNPAANNSIFKLNLIVTDNGCGTAATDTLTLIVKVVRPVNTKPDIVIQGSTAPVVFGEAFNFKVVSTDADNDALSVSIIGRNFIPAALGMKLTPLTGNGQVVSDFSWQLQCGQEILPEGYDLAFIVKDNNCQTAKADTIRTRLQVLPALADSATFLPPNIFTPNNDNRNDFFVMPTLPKDNCSDTFQEIKIYNRWGMQVYRSASRQFAWNGMNVSDGIYYYIIKYKQRKYKGYVTIIR